MDKETEVKDGGVPILRGHDQRCQIGVVRQVDGHLLVGFTADARITADMVFEIFGGAGLLVLEWDANAEEPNVPFIRKGRILEFSMPKPHTRST